MKRAFLLISMLSFCYMAFSQESDSLMIRKIFNESLANGESYENLRQLTTQVGARLSGSAGADKAVIWSKKVMENYHFDRVFLQDVMVPHWVRGEKESAFIQINGKKIAIPITALGGSVATPKIGISAEIIEVKSFEELAQLGKAKVEGKIVFFNRPMDATKISTFEAYGGAVNQRGYGATEAAKYGAVGAIIRSMNPSNDDFPHTGAMHYAADVVKIPTAAISTNGANLLSKLLKDDAKLHFFFKQSCETLPDAPSNNVIAEIKGSEKSDEIIVVGGHLDSWDLAQGAHDDGAGCVQAIEVLRILKSLNIHPKRTIRAVMFMNEENGLRGGEKYGELAQKNKENHIAAIESDNGGFVPRGFSLDGSAEKIAKIQTWKKLLAPYGLHDIEKGNSGADIGPLGKTGTFLMELKPDSQRYFDVHHTANDRIETVSERELKLGAAAMAVMVYLLDKYGL